MNEAPKWQRFLDWLAVMLTPWFVLAQGHRFGVGNHDFLLTFLRRIADPYYLAPDVILSNPPSHPQLLHAIAPLVANFGENGAFLMLHVGTRLFLLMGVWRLAMALLPGRPLIAVFAMLATFAEPRLRVGSHFLQGGHWEPAFLGMAAAVWTLAIGIRFIERESHWITLAMVAGFGFFAHLFIGGPIFVVVGAAAFLAGRRDREWLQAMLGAVALGSVTWLPALIGFLQGSSGPITGTQVIQLLQFRHPHHHQPWTWPVADFLQAGVFLLAAVWCWWRISDRGAYRRLAVPAVLLAWFLVTCVAFVVLGRMQVVPIIAYLQPFRLLSLLLLIGVLGMLEAGWRSTAGHGTVARLVVLFVMLILFRLQSLLGPAVVALHAAFCAWQGDMRALPAHSWTPPRRRWLALGALLGFGGIVSLQRSEALRNLTNRVHREHWLVAVEPNDPDRRELTEWIRDNTPGHALFAIPPAMDGFRLWEQRPIVVDLKNIPYRAPDLAEWAERYALAANIDPYVPFVKIPQADAPPWQMVLVATTYGARYVVLREPVNDRSVVFHNDSYTVLDLERASQIDPRGVLRPPLGTSSLDSNQSLSIRTD
ncbi:hypothetical protein GC173_00985 [bacterium]|nr:hypothetical protein [bacterium]